jgi:hypothetical protein
MKKLEGEGEDHVDGVGVNLDGRLCVILWYAAVLKLELDANDRDL